MGDTLAPIGPRRLDLGTLAPPDFELLCAWVVAIEYPEAIHVADPDGGADSAVRDSGAGWERCWQAKRFTSQVKWPQCKKSLDDAVETYKGLNHYTFCFARDLTAGQEKLFAKHLVGRHPGVTVDHWGQSRLEMILFGSEQGQRIVRHFFGDPKLDTQALMRAIRAGGALETGADILDRVAAVAEHLATRDPIYQYVYVATEADGPLPGLTPETVVAMHSDRGDSKIRIDAVLRNPSEVGQPPGGTVYMTEAQAEQFERFLRRGGDLELEGVRLDLHNMPAVFEELEPGGEDMSVRLSAPRVLPRRWHARFSVVDSEIEVEPFDVLLKPTADVEPEWDSALVGTLGGISVRVLFRANLTGGGTMNLSWSWRDDATRSAAARVQELVLVAALSSRGRLLVDDLNRERDRVEFAIEPRSLGDEMYALMAFLDDLATIEEWTGHGVTTAGTIPADEVVAVRDIARIIRAGESPMTFTEVVLDVPPEKVPEETPDGNHVLIEMEIGVIVLGNVIRVGKLRGELRDVYLEVGEPGPNGRIPVRIGPSTEEAKHPIFKLRRFTKAELAEGHAGT